MPRDLVSMYIIFISCHSNRAQRDAQGQSRGMGMKSKQHRKQRRGFAVYGSVKARCGLAELDVNAKLRGVGRKERLDDI